MKEAKELVAVARELMSADAPEWASPEFAVHFGAVPLKKFSGTYKGYRIWVLQSKGKIYKDQYGWISFSWSVNPSFEGSNWVVKSTLSFAPATSGSFARQKFEEFTVEVPISGKEDTALFGIHSRSLEVEPSGNDPRKDIEAVIDRHERDLKEAKGFWKRQKVT